MSKIFEYQNKIIEWSTRAKLTEIEELNIINKYCRFVSLPKNKIQLSADYNFYVYDIKQAEAKKKLLRGEAVCKLSLLKIINKFQKYFRDKINFEINFEKKNELESYNENKSIKYSLVPDTIIKISKKNSDQKFIIIFEYHEKKSHNKINDSNKEIRSIFNSNLYVVYNEKNENTKNLNLIKIYKKLIFDIFTFVCTLLDNKSILSKIIYFKDYEHINRQELVDKTNILNYILDETSKKKFDIKKLFCILRPYNIETGIEYKYKEFIDLLNSKYKINILFDKTSTFYDSKYFSQIIIKLNLENSDNISEYKDIFCEAMNALMIASDKIIEFQKRQSEKMQYLPNYLKIYSEFSIKNIRDKYIKKKIYLDLVEEFGEYKK